VTCAPSMKQDGVPVGRGPCVVCGDDTGVTKLPRAEGEHPQRLCWGCIDTLERREPLWLRALRWLLR